VELQERIEELRAQGLGVAAISYDSEDVLATFASRRGITDVPLLSDGDSSVIRAFGIYNYVAEEGLGPLKDDPSVQADVVKYVAVGGARPFVVGTPFPGTFVVDRDGRVTSRFFEEFYRERNTAANVMLKLGLPLSGIAGMEGETSHLEVRAFQSNPTVTLGSRFHLGLDVTPKPGIHVYAPGADEVGYRVIRLALQVPDFLKLLEVEYPASEVYYFEPLDEYAPVYLRPFRLTQEIVISAAARDALADIDVLTLTGRLDYQACDDKICFNPVSVPLTWLLTVAPLDETRANP
jgi:peroxiredoxin